MTIDAYAISVSLTLESNVPNVIGPIMEQFARLDAQIDKTMAKLRAFHDIAGTAFSMGAAVGEAQRMADLTGTIAANAERTRGAYGSTALMLAPPGGGKEPPAGGGPLNYTAPGKPEPNKPSGGTGAVSAWGIWGLIQSLVHPIEAVFDTRYELEHQRAILQQNLGGDTPEALRLTNQAEAVARKAASDIPGTTVTENLHRIMELKAIFGDLDMAENELETFLSGEQLLMDVGGKVAERGGGAAFLAAQISEARGRTSGPNAAKQIAEDMTELARVEYATAGRIDPQSYLAYVRQSRAAGMLLSQEFLYRELPAVMLGLGGFRAGTGTQTAFQELVAGRTTQQAALLGVKYGLVDPASIKGKRLDVMTSGMLFGDEAAHDQFQWVETRLMPALITHGVIDPVQQIKAISAMFPNRTGSGWIVELERLKALVAKEYENIDQTNPSLAFENANDPAQRWRNISASQTNLGAIGYGGVADAWLWSREIDKSVMDWFLAPSSDGPLARDAANMGGPVGMIQALYNWIAHGSPVTISNGGDLVNGITKQQVRGLAGPQSTPSGPYIRDAPYSHLFQ